MQATDEAYKRQRVTSRLSGRTRLAFNI